MSSLVPVMVHSSQFPQNIRRDLIESLRTRKINHKFHYESVKQAQQWLALHQAYSPSRHDPDCARIYNEAFHAAARSVASKQVHLIGLGAGGGQKDTRLLKLLREAGRETFYAPCDVSTAMVLTARNAACGGGRNPEAAISADHCFPIVCDLAKAEDLPEVLDRLRAARRGRIITFFGMIPNFEPEIILPRLARMVRKTDLLLFSANLAPGPDYERGVQKVLPQYENALTKEWLMTVLLDLGIQRKDGDVRFSINSDYSPEKLRRIEACFHFRRTTKIRVESRQFEFRRDASIRLFFSYRYTPTLVRATLERHGLIIRDQWKTRSEEEGVFLVRKAAHR